MRRPALDVAEDLAEQVGRLGCGRVGRRCVAGGVFVLVIDHGRVLLVVGNRGGGGLRVMF